MTDSYAIVHFWPMRGGFRQRIEMLIDVLAQRGAVHHVGRWAALARLLCSRQFRSGKTSLIIYTSLLAPLVALVKFFWPGVRVYYMVRGDEMSWALHEGRRWRAFLALRLQKLLERLGACFVFASGDLEAVFGRRLGGISKSFVLPNTLGQAVGPLRRFDGTLALVGDFGSVKNVEAVIAALDGGQFQLDLYGNRSEPQRWRRPWLNCHGVVADLPGCLRRHSLVVLASVSEGFPNVLLDALQAGCGVVAREGFPFEHLAIHPAWRFRLEGQGNLQQVLKGLLQEGRDFRQDNPTLIGLVESDWSQRVWEIFEAGGDR